MSILAVEGVGKNYSGFEAVKNVTFSLEAGETLALDQSVHLLSFFGRVYLEEINHNSGFGNTSSKPLDAEEECEPAETNKRPAMETPDMLLPEQCPPRYPRD